MAAPLKTQRTVRFARQPSVKSQNLRDTMNRQESRRIKSKTPKFQTSNGWWLNPQGDWILCEIVHQDDDIVTIKNVNEELKVGIADVLPFNSDVVSDMTSLRYLHEPGILYNLQHRLLDNSPYTYMGSILISVNPFEWLQGPTMTEFIGKSMNPDKPHPYAIAELCSQQICVRSPRNQSVVISGESGAGKTESAKMVLNHIVNRGNVGSKQSADESNGSSLEDRLMKSSPILEAFGNAKTVRNSNSSRFGKYIRMFFHPLVHEQDMVVPVAQCVRKIAGAAIETYLLEKSRVTAHAIEERNYHVFYYLVLAKDSGLSNISLSHASFQEYLLLNPHRQAAQSSSPGKVARGRGMEKQPSRLLRQDFQDQEGIKDGLEQFRELQEAFRSLNYTENDVTSVWNIIGAVLEIGNISFSENDTPEGSVAEISSITYLENAASLLGISAEKLRACLTTTVSTVRGETISKQLNLRDSTNAKSAVCKSIYASLFHYIVGTINISLATNSSCFDDDNCTSIGVLDIFGFESFKRNEFEQLLINYANEVLQSSFNTQVFQNELMLYQAENISTNLTIEQCPNNLGCVTLLDSVLASLESVSERSIQPNEVFFEVVNKQFDAKKNDAETSKYFAATHPKDKKAEFKIKHYAETVTYHAGERDSTSWGFKNNDKIPKELKATLVESTDKIVIEMILVDLDARQGGETLTKWSMSTDTNESPVKKTMTPKAPKKQSISVEFKNSISSLCSTLAQSNCAFIRCIKPNPLLKPLTYDERYALQQIKSLGLVQVCSVMQIGLPTRISYVELKSLLKSMLSEIEPLFQNESEEVFIASLLYAFDIPPEIYQLGRTRLFFKAGQLDVLEKMLTTDYESKKEEIVTRITSALHERRQCEETIQVLKALESELNEKLKNTTEFVKTSRTELSDMYLIDKEDIKSKYNSVNINVIGESMSACQFAIDDVRNYGQSLSLSDEYAPIGQSIEENVIKLSKLESLWNSINIDINKVELYLKENTLFPIEECFQNRLDQSTKFLHEMNFLSHSINELVFDANRCLISKALQKGSEIREKLGQFQDSLELQYHNAMDEYSNLKKDESNRYKSLLRLFDHLVTLQSDSSQICSEIQASCTNTRVLIDELRKKIIADEEKLKEEIKRAEEQERIDREKREIEAALEYELKEQIRIGIEETEKMMLEDRLSREREKRERFGRNTSSVLEPIVEAEENEADDQSDVGDQKLPAVEHLPVPAISTVSPSEQNLDANAHRSTVNHDSSTAASSSHPAQSRRFSPDAKPAMKDIRLEGQLLKQSGFLGMWKHKYFVLENAILKYYKHEKDKLENNGSCKIFVLTSSTVLAYAKLSLVFKVINEDAGEELCLMANSKDTLDQWIETLKLAISRLYNIQKKRKSTATLKTEFSHRNNT